MTEPIVAAPPAPAAPATPPPAPAPAAPKAPEPMAKKPDAAAPAAPAKPGDPPAAPEDKKPGEEAPDPAKPFKIKVNGKEKAVSAEELIAMAQKAEGSETKFQEASKMRRQAELLVRALKENPIAVLTNPNIGIDVKKLAQEYLLKEIEREKMTPEQLELHDAREKLRKAEEDKRAQQATQEQEQMQKLVEHHRTQIQADIIATLETAGLPRTNGTVRRMAYYMAEGLKRGIPLMAKDVVELVHKDYLSEFAEFFGATDGDTISKLLGDPIIKKIRESELKRVQVTPPAVPAQAAAVTGEDGKPAKMSKEEWQKQLDARFGK